jgi:hypothetical protein
MTAKVPFAEPCSEPPNMPDCPSATDRPQLFRAAFDRYVASTDGKEKLAQEIVAIARSMQAARLLDLGAGNGTLTRLVSPHFQAIVAVEQNSAFEAPLSLVPNAVTVISRMEDYVPVEPPDIVLMSYSLDGIPVERLGSTMTALASRLAPRASRRSTGLYGPETGQPCSRFSSSSSSTRSTATTRRGRRSRRSWAASSSRSRVSGWRSRPSRASSS